MERVELHDQIRIFETKGDDDFFWVKILPANEKKRKEKGNVLQK